jgi:hypothetical protein
MPGLDGHRRNTTEERVMKKLWITTAAAVALGGLSLAGLGARADDKKPEPPAKTAPATPAAAAFERLKKLAGDWNNPEGKLAVTYRVISGGSTIMETLAPGTPYEMVSMYFMDHGDLLMTHYCAMGNQPQMKWKAGADASTLVFEFVGGTNLDASKDMHMHEATFVLKDDDHVHADWTAYEGGAKKGTHSFDHTRVKK